MAKRIDFTFSDLIAGYVRSFDKDAEQFVVATSEGREYTIRLTPTTFAELVRNLGEPYKDATHALHAMLVPGRYLFCYGVFFPDGDENDYLFDAKHIVFLGRTENEFAFEKRDWWIKQVRQLADFYLQAEFPEGKIDFLAYRTNIDASGRKMPSSRQEADTISRLVYGFASAYLLTGEERFLTAAEQGTQYLRTHFRALDLTEGVCYWYHAVDITREGTEQKIFASEFGDDYNAIPCYEQIYALAGPAQTYRVTGDPKIIFDVDHTINLFNRFFKDKTELGGYFSHIDPITFDPHADNLGQNKGRKNWNSVGDHAPAYLINMYLATGADRYAEFLEYTFDTICARFPDYDHSPFVQEKFFADWSKDQAWGWQQNRAVVGHNLKIAWNLMRMNSLREKPTYKALAQKIAELMPAAGSDLQRGGWYDVVERSLEPNRRFHRFAWHDRKAWWQQEQAILAYLILAGTIGGGDYRKIARESAAFYNAWFLDTDLGGVYFNVLANGLPYALGTERGKGSHSMSGYHSFELAYLASVYTNLLITNEPLDLHFKPKPGGFMDGKLRVLPDILPAGSVRIAECWIDGRPHSDFDETGCIVQLPENHGEIKVMVRLVASAVGFSAELLEARDGTALIALEGKLGPAGRRYLEEEIEDALEAGALTLKFEASRLQALSSEAMRFLAMLKQRHGKDIRLVFIKASPEIAAAIQESGFAEELNLE
jgi:mannose/cellobiose epimerase-like protein (N-acyl-D-glucosamine 2-epimerase family)